MLCTVIYEVLHANDLSRCHAMRWEVSRPRLMLRLVCDKPNQRPEFRSKSLRLVASGARGVSCFLWTAIRQTELEGFASLFGSGGKNGRTESSRQAPNNVHRTDEPNKDLPPIRCSSIDLLVGTVQYLSCQIRSESQKLILMGARREFGITYYWTPTHKYHAQTSRIQKERMFICEVYWCLTWDVLFVGCLLGWGLTVGLRFLGAWGRALKILMFCLGMYVCTSYPKHCQYHALSPNISKSGTAFYIFLHSLLS